MKFNWDNANVEHIARHEVTPEEAEQVLTNEPLDVQAVTRNGELRTLHLGQTDGGRTLLIVTTERKGACRVVTARPANRKERTFYLEHKALAYEDDNSSDS